MVQVWVLRPRRRQHQAVVLQVFKQRKHRRVHAQAACNDGEWYEGCAGKEFGAREAFAQQPDRKQARYRVGGCQVRSRRNQADQRAEEGQRDGYGECIGYDQNRRDEPDEPVVVIRVVYLRCAGVG